MHKRPTDATMKKLAVNVRFDRPEHRYYIESSDIQGLHIEAATADEFLSFLREIALEFTPAGAPITLQANFYFAPRLAAQ